MQASDENKEKYQLWNYPMIQYQILQANIMRIIWQTVKRITNEILGVKEPEWLWKNPFTFMLLFSLWTCCWFTHTNMWFFLLLLLSKYKQVFCSSLKAWMSVITAFWKIVLKYTWTWYGNCLSAPCNQKNMLCLLIYQENFTYSVDSDQSESLISVSVYFGWSVFHLLLALCTDADD